MKFLTESSSNILIYKYNKRDKQIQDTESGIILMGVDSKSTSMRLPKIRGKRYFVNKNQIAEYDSVYYLPADQVEGIEDEYLDYPKPLKRQYMSKFEWLGIKTRHPYKERS